MDQRPVDITRSGDARQIVAVHPDPVLTNEGIAALSDELALRQLRVVHRLAAALHQADSPLAFYEEAVEAVVSTLGVDRASLLLFDPDGIMRFKAWRGLSASYRRTVEGHTPWSQDDADAEPILVPDVAADPGLAEFLPVFRVEGIRALAFVPLVHRRRLVGKFMLYYDDPHAFSVAEVSVAEILAAHVALALERRRTEEELRRQQERLQLALAAGEMGTWDWDIPAGTVEWSPTLEALHGLAPGAFPGTFEAFQQDMHPDDRTDVLAAIQAVVDGFGDIYEMTYRIVRPDGSIGWVSASGQMLRDEAGRPVRLVGVCGDVSARRESELERERSLEAERVVRIEAEASAARIASLQRVTADLSRALTVAEVAEVVLSMAVTELGAGSGSLCLLDGETLEIVHSLGYDDDVTTHWARFPLEADLPASDAVRTNQAIFLRSSEERSERYPIFATSPVVGDESFAMIPMTDGTPIGCLVVGFPEPREFSRTDEAFLLALAGQCAGAVHRARLYEDRERARTAAERTRAQAMFLAEVSALLATSVDDGQTLVRVAERAVPQLADWCVISSIEEGRIVPVAVAHDDPQKAAMVRALLERFPSRLSDPIGIGAVARHGRTEIYAEASEAMLLTAAADVEHLELLRGGRFGPAVAVPLTTRRGRLGVLALTNEPGRLLDDQTVELAEALASRTAIAVDNARLFREKARVSQTLQASLLPPTLPDIPGVEVGAAYRAGAAGVEVGGDFYDVFAIDADRHVIVLGDVCGRGVEAAALAALARHTIRSASLIHSRPAAILAHTNEVLLRQQLDEYASRFCTALTAAIEPLRNGDVLVALAVAGHPLPLLRRRGGHVQRVGIPGSLLGVDPAAESAEVELLLRPGDTLVGFTDGATERRKHTTFFGEEGMIETIRGTAGSAQTLADAIEQAVLSFGPDEPEDDLAVLVLHVPLI